MTVDPDLVAPSPQSLSRTEGSHGLLAEWAAMVRFYSRLPVPSLGRHDDPAAPPPFARACRMLPLAAAVIAVPASLVLAGLSLTRLPAEVTASVAVAVAMLTTGALHEDGLADMADGFGGGHTRARKLEIMKDSRLGSYGASAMVLALLARVGLLAALITQDPLAAAMAWTTAAILSRSLALVLFRLLPGARADGVASSVGRPDGTAVCIAVLVALLLMLALCGPIFVPTALATGLIMSVAVTAAVGRLAMTQIGGQTGDVLGAAQVIAEIAFLAGLVAG